MNNDKQVAFRLPSALVEQIDAQVEDWSSKAPGIRVTRADVVRALLVQGLAGESTNVTFQVAAPPANIEQSPTPIESNREDESVTHLAVSSGGPTGLTMLGGNWD